MVLLYCLKVRLSGRCAVSKQSSAVVLNFDIDRNLKRPTPSPLQPRDGAHVTVFTYKVRDTNTSMNLVFNRDVPLHAGAVRDLLSRCIYQVNSIMQDAGDIPVPGQNFYKELQWAQDEWVHFSMHSDRAPHAMMTYGLVKDTLNALRYYMVAGRFAFVGDVVVTNERLGQAGYAALDRADGPA
ncbi:MAG: hypothetical protein Q9225_006797 [Loekoesia sp. 1 TL-2023]